MVILKWLQRAVVGNNSEVTKAAAGQSADEKKKAEKNSSVDLVNATLVEHAEDLEDLIKSGSRDIERKKLKRKVKSRVEGAIANEFNDPELVEEITERITDVAEIDPFYKRLFS